MWKEGRLHCVVHAVRRRCGHEVAHSGTPHAPKVHASRRTRLARAPPRCARLVKQRPAPRRRARPKAAPRRCRARASPPACGRAITRLRRAAGDAQFPAAFCATRSFRAGARRTQQRLTMAMHFSEDISCRNGPSRASCRPCSRAVERRKRLARRAREPHLSRWRPCPDRFCHSGRFCPCF